MISIALFEPEIPQNCGTILRLADCLGVVVHIIEPCGFIFGGKQMRRAGLDYLNTAQYILHKDIQSFLSFVDSKNLRLILATTKSSNNYYDFKFENNDVIMFGKESAGVPSSVHNLITHKICIKMQENKRSINLAMSCAIILSEGIRQVKL